MAKRPRTTSIKDQASQPDLLSARLIANISCQLPDELWSLGYIERYVRARYNADFCTLDGSRYFIRCVLPVPFNYRKGSLGWGLWVEVSKQIHDAYLAFHTGNRGLEGQSFEGQLANNLKPYRALRGLAVSGQFSTHHRPYLSLAASSEHKLARESRDGLDAVRYQEILDQTGMQASTVETAQQLQ